MILKPEDFDIKLPRYNDFIFENPINEEAIEAFDESRKLRERSQQAQIDSAKDISDMKNDMQIVISNQQSQLERQEKIIEQLLSLNDVQSEQLDKLKKLCEMLEEGDNLDKEYKEEIIILLNKKTGWKDFIIDKGTDVVINGIIMATQMLLEKYVL